MVSASRFESVALPLSVPPCGSPRASGMIYRVNGDAVMTSHTPPHVHIYTFADCAITAAGGPRHGPDGRVRGDAHAARGAPVHFERAGGNCATVVSVRMRGCRHRLSGGTRSKRNRL